MTSRDSALATMTERFPQVEARVQRVWGLRLPRHVAVFAALAASDGDALDEIGLSPWGVTDLFRDGGLDLRGRDGLDERLHARFRCDAAEFVTVMGGDTDGLHYGLWYDDPAQLPGAIAYNYARDSGETWLSGATTLLGVARERVEGFLRDYGDEEEEAARVGPLIEALDWYEAASSAGPVAARRAHLAVAPMPLLPPGSGDPRAAASGERLDAFRKDAERAAAWIAEARQELDAGRPALALAVGAELHWLDRDAYRQNGLDLLLGAYRALGRDALAEIATVHAAHRDLRSVQVLVAPR
ncbi:ADP-ribosylation family protein [Catenuloplanes japonicus]|uniref:ADP-ribosylation family protein n=1 Tax=Catenuloplanes japonicus TaxID=33876 RepID=UPI000524DBDD|nr:ADP-ribosylation family protein [Catenuloplanes japonicus]